MGLLGKAGTQAVPPKENSTQDIKRVITEFSKGQPLFHCVVIWIDEGSGKEIITDINNMSSGHGVLCIDLPGKNCLILLPGELDMELFSHRFSKSTGSTVRFQFSANSLSLALETSSPYLQ